MLVKYYESPATGKRQKNVASGLSEQDFFDNINDVTDLSKQVFLNYIFQIVRECSSTHL